MGDPGSPNRPASREASPVRSVLPSIRCRRPVDVGLPIPIARGSRSVSAPPRGFTPIWMQTRTDLGWSAESAIEKFRLYISRGDLADLLKTVQTQGQSIPRPQAGNGLIEPSHDQPAITNVRGDGGVQSAPKLAAAEDRVSVEVRETNRHPRRPLGARPGHRLKAPAAKHSRTSQRIEGRSSRATSEGRCVQQANRRLCRGHSTSADTISTTFQRPDSLSLASTPPVTLLSRRK